MGQQPNKEQLLSGSREHWLKGPIRKCSWASQTGLSIGPTAGRDMQRWLEAFLRSSRTTQMHMKRRQAHARDLNSPLVCSGSGWSSPAYSFPRAGGTCQRLNFRQETTLRSGPALAESTAPYSDLPPRALLAVTYLETHCRGRLLCNAYWKQQLQLLAAQALEVVAPSKDIPVCNNLHEDAIYSLSCAQCTWNLMLLA